MKVRPPEIAPKSNGHLLCDFHNTYWCIDIEDFIKSGSDAELVWGKYPDGEVIQVPIVPSSNVWAEIHLRKPENARSQMYRVGLAIDDASESIFIGFLHPSEGRIVLRSMVLDWFGGTQNVDNLTCVSRGHGYAQNKKLEHDQKYPALLIAQQWSIWRTGKCLGCTFDPNDNKDLVPDVPAPAGPWASGGPV